MQLTILTKDKEYLGVIGQLGLIDQFHHAQDRLVV